MHRQQLGQRGSVLAIITVVCLAVLPHQAMAQCSPGSFDPNGGLVTVEFFKVVNNVEVPIALSPLDIALLFDGDTTTGTNVGRFLDLIVRVTLDSPDPSATLDISAFTVTTLSECEPVDGFVGTGEYTDLNDNPQAISVTSTGSGPIFFQNDHAFDVGSSIGVANGGVMQVRIDYGACEPETIVTEIDIEGDVCLPLVAVDEVVWSQVKRLYRN